MRLGAKAQGETGRGGFARNGAMQSSEWEAEDGVDLRWSQQIGSCVNYRQSAAIMSDRGSAVRWLSRVRTCPLRPVGGQGKFFRLITASRCRREREVFGHEAIEAVEIPHLRFGIEPHGQHRQGGERSFVVGFDADKFGQGAQRTAGRGVFRDEELRVAGLRGGLDREPGSADVERCAIGGVDEKGNKRRVVGLAANRAAEVFAAVDCEVGQRALRYGFGAGRALG